MQRSNPPAPDGLGSARWNERRGTSCPIAIGTTGLEGHLHERLFDTGRARKPVVARRDQVFEKTLQLGHSCSNGPRLSGHVKANTRGSRCLRYLIRKASRWGKLLESVSQAGGSFTVGVRSNPGPFSATFSAPQPEWRLHRLQNLPFTTNLVWDPV